MISGDDLTADSLGLTVKVAELVLAPKALGNAVLTETDRRLGCALVDLGAETTTVSVYKNNILPKYQLTAIPLLL